MSKWNYNNPVFECDELNYDLLKFAPWSGHRNFVYDFIEFFKPEVVVELGSHYGCSAFTFAQAVKDFNLNTKMYFVDTWQGDDFTKKYDNDVYTLFSKTVQKFYRNQSINMLRMTFDEACKKFDNNFIDVLHIDGSHYYDDVKRDFETWYKKVKNDGIIMLHDVSSDIVLGDVMGSYRFWQELKEKFEFTAEFDFSWGLGIIFLNKEKYELFNAVIDMSKYQRINNALDVEFKDQLRKNYFQLKDKEIYIEDLLSQRDILNLHLAAYKEDIKAKQEYLDSMKADIEKLLENHNTEKTEIIKIYECDKANIIKNYEDNKSKIIKDYEKGIEDIKSNYEKNIEDIKNNYEETIRTKDNYIEELERIKAEKDILEMEYLNTIEYKLKKIKRKIVK